jgi:hypothetical protein
MKGRIDQNHQEKNYVLIAGSQAICRQIARCHHRRDRDHHPEGPQGTHKDPMGLQGQTFPGILFPDNPAKSTPHINQVPLHMEKGTTEDFQVINRDRSIEEKEEKTDHINHNKILDGKRSNQIM